MGGALLFFIPTSGQPFLEPPELGCVRKRQGTRDALLWVSDEREAFITPGHPARSLKRPHPGEP